MIQASPEQATQADQSQCYIVAGVHKPRDPIQAELVSQVCTHSTHNVFNIYSLTRAIFKQIIMLSNRPTDNFIFFTILMLQ